MGDVMLIHRNYLADGRVDEHYTPQPKSFLDDVRDFFHPEVHCVTRCGVYKGNYSISPKAEVLASGEYEDKTGCSGIGWVAFEGDYSACRQFTKQNQTYVYFERS